MPRVLVEDSKVTCGAKSPHQGAVKMTGAERLVVEGSRVLTTASVLAPAKTIPFPGCTNPASATGPCTKIATMTQGTSTRLQVDGVFVVLDSLQATTDKAGVVKVDPLSVNNDLLTAD